MKPAEIKEQWEEIGFDTKRLPVPGGWLVVTCYHPGSYDAGAGVHQIFIADLGHSWKGSLGLRI